MVYKDGANSEVIFYVRTGPNKISVKANTSIALTSVNTTAFAYDGQGRRRSKGSISFTYDKDGRVVKQSNGLEFIYDQSGIAGIKYNNAPMFTVKTRRGILPPFLTATGISW